MNWTPERPFQALALTGGGYRGLFAARALEVMEAHAGYPIARSFDLICGTSIGGIIALAAAFEVPMAKAVKVFVDEGLEIFPPHQRPSSSAQRFCDLYKHRSRPRYSVGPLRNAITQLIPEETILGDALHPVAIPASPSQGADITPGGGCERRSPTSVLRGTCCTRCPQR